MTNTEFHTFLTHASNAALNFAKIYVVDKLPSDFKYSVCLNVSTDFITLKKFEVYPNDDKKTVEYIAPDTVVSLLNRKGKVPVWIDISVAYVHVNHTVFQLLCAGRYSEDENDFYYLKVGTGPFGIKSPNFPIDYVEGVKFNLKSKPKRIFF